MVGMGIVPLEFEVVRGARNGGNMVVTRQDERTASEFGNSRVQRNGAAYTSCALTPMSRQQPFPTPRRANNPPPVAYDGRFDNTLPLSVNRPTSRPMTPSSSTGSGTPSRPARSERRPRHASQYSISSISSRDMPYDGASIMSSDTAGPSRSQASVTDSTNDDGQAPPVALKAVLNAFQQAGAQRKRAMTNGTLEREKERERELEEEAQRQKRIREKVPGRRVNGKSKAIGGIDCESSTISEQAAFLTYGL